MDLKFGEEKSCGGLLSAESLLRVVQGKMGIGIGLLLPGKWGLGHWMWDSQTH